MDDLDLGQTLRGFSAGQKVFGRYTLTRMLGRGGMGVVWLARDGELDQDVALKFLPEAVMDDLAAVDDLRRETRRARELSHPYIVRIHDFVRDTRLAAISMEYVAGDSLANRRMSRASRIYATAEIAPWVEQLCEALEYAHTKAKIVHRDLKPANLMLDARGDLKVADFGISATLADTTTRMSKQAGSSGTPVYMSLQQMMGEKPAATDDVYALGATIYELLTGKPPFYTGNILLQVQNKVPPTMMARRAELGVGERREDRSQRTEDSAELSQVIPQAWEETVAACLAKDPAQRPQSAAAVWARLSGKPGMAAASAAVSPARQTEAAPAQPPVPPVLSNPIAGQQIPAATPRARSRKTLGLTLTALGVAAVLVLGYFGWYVPEQRRQVEIARQEMERQVAEAVRRREEQARQEAAEAARAKAERERIAAEEAARQRAIREQQAAEAAAEVRRREAEARRVEAEARAENERRIAAERARVEAVRREAEQRKQQAVDALLAEAAQKSGQGDKSGAITLYTQVIASSDASEDQQARAYYGRGRAYYDRKEYIDADSDFTHAMYSNSSSGVSSDAMRMHNDCVNAQIQEQMELYQQQMQMIMSAPY